jgi:plastocyanin
VYTDQDGSVVPTLIEGPRGKQVRCQDEGLPCSYLDLKQLHENGNPIPKGLGMSKAELGRLVGQLDQTNAAIEGLGDVDGACAAGYHVSSTQNPNMGIHMVHAGYSADGTFDPSHPEMVLAARKGGWRATRSQVGTCVDGHFEGPDGYDLVGAVFQIPMTPAHPDAFAGPLDNWHIHFNTCGLAEAENQRGLTGPAACEADGGIFLKVIPVWMMHAYVVPGFDSQSGVFAMWNTSIWPKVDDLDQVRDVRTQAAADGSVAAPINNFSFGEVTAKVGDTIRFANSDSVPHSVTSDDFDSGEFGTGQSYARTFERPGKVRIYCSLHPQMQGTITVE